MMNAVLSTFRLFIIVVSALGHVLLLAMRLWIANIFWKSGVLKFNDWDTTLLLFTEEHPVPYLSPQMAAFSGTTFELLCPVLLTLGLGGRLATLPLLVMTAVIQFTYMQHEQHYYWAFFLGAILCFGPGKISVDHLIKRLFLKRLCGTHVTLPEAERTA